MRSLNFVANASRGVMLGGAGRGSYPLPKGITGPPLQHLAKKFWGVKVFEGDLRRELRNPPRGRCTLPGEQNHTFSLL